jgi:hypothetical protein
VKSTNYEAVHHALFFLLLTYTTYSPHHPVFKHPQFLLLHPFENTLFIFIIRKYEYVRNPEWKRPLEDQDIDGN